MTRELFILTILREAGTVCMKGFGHVRTVKTKENYSDIVTDMDVSSERKIVSHIKHRFPEDTIIAEETGYRAGGGKGTWIIDPIDGTSNFAAGVPWFGIMIAYLEEELVQASGIYLPAMEELYYAERARGAYCNGRKIRVSAERKLQNCLVACGVDYDDDPRKRSTDVALIERLVSSSRNIRSTNSAVDDCYVACGRFGGSLFRHNMVWDVAAPSLIIEEAGGLYTDDAGLPLRFALTEQDYRRNYVSVAANPSLHRQLLELMNR